MSKYLSIRFQKAKYNKGTKSGKRYYKSFVQQYNHDIRQEDIEDGYLKTPERTKENFVISTFDDVKDIEDRWIDIEAYHKKNKGRKLDKQIKPTLSFLLSFSKGFDLDQSKAKEQCQAIAYFIKKRFGDDVLNYIAPHFDEKSYHVHFSIMNYDKKNLRSIASHLDPSKLQDEIADFLKEHNQDYGHIRGQSKVQTQKTNISIMEAKEKEHLERISFLEEKIAAKENELQSLMNENKELMRSSYANLTNTLNDFVEFGLSFKGKDKGGIEKMALRYLNKGQFNKFDSLVEKLERERNKYKNTLNP